MSDAVTCHNYTPGRRHQKVIGRIGATVLPFTVTIPQLLVVIVVVPTLVATARFWAVLAPAPLVIPTVTVAAAWAVRFARIEGRSPLWAAVGRMQLALAPAGGVTGGRPTRRPRTRHTATTVTVLDNRAPSAAAAASTGGDVAGAGLWHCLDVA